MHYPQCMAYTHTVYNTWPSHTLSTVHGPHTLSTLIQHTQCTATAWQWLHSVYNLCTKCIQVDTQPGRAITQTSSNERTLTRRRAVLVVGKLRGGSWTDRAVPGASIRYQAGQKLIMLITPAEPAELRLAAPDDDGSVVTVPVTQAHTHGRLHHWSVVRTCATANYQG